MAKDTVKATVKDTVKDTTKDTAKEFRPETEGNPTRSICRGNIFSHVCLSVSLFVIVLTFEILRKYQNASVRACQCMGIGLK